MTTQTKKEKRGRWYRWNFEEAMEQMAGFHERATNFTSQFRRDTKPATSLDWAVRGCFVVGVVGLIKAIGMPGLAGVLSCLLVSLAAFGLVIFVRSRQP